MGGAPRLKIKKGTKRGQIYFFSDAHPTLVAWSGTMGPLQFPPADEQDWPLRHRHSTGADRAGGSVRSVGGRPHNRLPRERGPHAGCRGQSHDRRPQRIRRAIRVPWERGHRRVDDKSILMPDPIHSFSWAQSPHRKRRSSG